tara:strand:- start:501 stop:1139 length:639 start_codon:yes stop_codon:yes gene_type:complete
MVKVNPSSSVVALAILIFGLSGLPLNAQQSEEFQPRNVISANPIGLLINTFNGEFERVISPTSTIGFGGSTSSYENQTYSDAGEQNSQPIWEDIQYVNFDVFYRFYPGSNRTRTYRAPIGWAFGIKAGVTSVDGAGVGDGTYIGYGFDVNRSWVLGPNENFYIGLGFGLKRLVGVPKVDTDWGRESVLAGKIPWIGGDLYSTIRVINVGFVF